jgi:mono/diheme cytochrome c family protein
MKNTGLARRITITLVVLAAPFIIGLLLTYQKIQFDWISFMEIQPSFRPMEAPLPLPADSVPVAGAAYIPSTGSPINPSAPGPDSIARGKALYTNNCALCHGDGGTGDGPVAGDLERKPTDLTSPTVTSLSDGEIFLVVTNGLQVGAARKGGMPALRENLAVQQRWDVVNYVRTLQGATTVAALAYTPGKCIVRALDLIAAWVSAKAPEKDAFPFSDASGQMCQGSFSVDVLPLFAQANLWYAGAPSCRTCHSQDVQNSYARLDLSNYQGILAGSGRSSPQEQGENILGNGDWEKSTLYDVLSKGEMPPTRPPDINLRGPLIAAGAPK